MNDEFSHDEPTPTGVGTTSIDVRKLSQSELGRLGLQQIAYVKPVVINGANAFAIHAADGTPMAVAPDQIMAMAAIVQHEMVPALVH